MDLLQWKYGRVPGIARPAGLSFGFVGF